MLPPDVQACLAWLRAVNTQSWRAPAPPALPARPADAEAGAFYDYLAPVFAQTAQVWQQLAPWRAGER